MNRLKAYSEMHGTGLYFEKRLKEGRVGEAQLVNAKNKKQLLFVCNRLTFFLEATADRSSSFTCSTVLVFGDSFAANITTSAENTRARNVKLALCLF